MSTNSSNDHFFKSNVLGHPSGLFVLFFTEMWERFSYYGMRALLVLFFTASLLDEGWGWPKEHALAIFGTYTSLVYLSTMLGGYFADKIIGYRWAVVVGALLMTIGHGCMAMETTFFIYTGLVFLVFGSGFFKPNMTSIISEMYKYHPEKKDGAYTIFYMGVNAGAFFGIMLCGYLGEKIGWSWGFGVAGIFMLFGLLQFWLAQDIFGDIGLKPKVKTVAEANLSFTEEKGGPENPFTTVQLGIIALAAFLGLTWIFNDPISKITEGATNLYSFKVGGMDGNNVVILTALSLFILLLIMRIPKYIPVVRDRMLAITFFAFIFMFFWSIFEQSPGSLTLFARDYTQRILEGTAGTIFKIVDAMMTIIPLAIITWVLIKLFRQTFARFAVANIVLAFSFVIIWGISLWKVSNDFKSSSYVVEYPNNNGDMETAKVVSSKAFNPGDKLAVIDNESVTIYDPTAEGNKNKTIANNVLLSADNQKLGEIFQGKVGRVFQEDKIGAAIQINKAEINFTNALGQPINKIIKLSKDNLVKYPVGSDLQVFITHSIGYDNKQTSITQATVKAKESAVEIGATWFSILNSLFIIALAPLFSRWWESKYNPSANGKYAIGMFLLGLGMAVVAVGASGIAPGAKSASVSIIWLVLVYLFHTMAELCISPVALSYVSKLVPGRMIAVMFGIWYLAVAIGMKLAGMFGEYSESIAEEKGMSTFFWMLTGVSLALSALALLTTPILKKLMHGIR
jgi:proton-dependent oligopeptide transporter, POT family